MCLINTVESTQLLVVDFHKSQLEILKLNCALNRILLPPTDLGHLSQAKWLWPVDNDRSRGPNILEPYFGISLSPLIQLIDF